MKTMCVKEVIVVSKLCILLASTQWSERANNCFVCIAGRLYCSTTVLFHVYIVSATGLRLYGRAWGKIYRMVGPVKTATQCKSFFDDYRDDPHLQLHKALSEHNIIKVCVCVLLLFTMR